MEKIVVIGAGTMGNGIAHTAAASGFAVTLIDVGDDVLQRAVSTISANLQRGVDKGKMTADEKQAVLGRITAATGDDAVAEADIVIEAIDYPGFVANRVLMPMINEAAFALYEGVATAEAIDGVMELGMNHPMGPLTLADFIGLDVCLAILRVLEEGFGDPKYRPCPLLVKMVDAGWLGRKTKRGFYSY